MNSCLRFFYNRIFKSHLNDVFFTSFKLIIRVFCLTNKLFNTESCKRQVKYLHVINGDVSKQKQLDFYLCILHQEIISTCHY